jgi:predicted ATPase
MTYREAELDETCCLNDVLSDLHRERLAVRIKLARLDREQTREMLTVMFQTDISDEFLDGIYRETQGNPFFIEEVCKALIDEGKIYRENVEWQRSSMDEIRIPQSVRLAIQSRVRKLPTQARDVLRLAAIVGREFDFDILQKASGLDEEVLIDALETAERAQLIGELKRTGRETFAFAHGLTMTTLRESISGLRRRRLHRRVAAVIEALRPGDLEALAYHYGEAGDEERALVYVLRAANRARKVYANEEAIRLYSDALDLMHDDAPERFAVLASRNQVYGVVARREAQRDDVEAMLALAEDLDDDVHRCDALIAQADFYLETESYRAREPSERAVAIAQRLGDPVREGHALRRLGREARYRYDYSQGRDALETATARFQEVELPAEAAVCKHMLSLVLGNQGEHSAALKAAEDALALSRTAEDRRQEAISLRRLAIVYLNTFKHPQGLPFAEAALALHRELGDRSEECKALNVLGVITGWMGRAEDAKRHFFQSLELAEAIGSSMGVRAAITNLLWSHFYLQGEYEAALAFLEERLTKARQADDQFLVGHIRSQKPRLLGFLGQYGSALELLQTLLPTLEELMGQAIQATYLSYMGRLQAELGAHDLAHEHLDAAFERAGKTAKAVDTATLLIDRAYAALLEGGEARLRFGLEQTNQANVLLKETEAVIELAEAFHVAAQLRLALGEADAALKDSSECKQLASTWPSMPHGYLFTYSRALRAVGRKAEADGELQRAYERVTSIASRIKEDALRRSWLENVRENRDILAEWASSGMMD